MATPQQVRSQIRRRLHAGAQRTYWLVEIQGPRQSEREAFLAPSDADALERALDVAEGEVFEVWQGDRLVRRWTLDDLDSRSFAPR
jgi:hypothetical protein